MKTLIELFDERIIENILGPEQFRPDRVVYLCSEETALDKRLHRRLRSFFAYRGINLELEFVETGFYRTDSILRQLRGTLDKYDNCALDVTGGTDAALFAAGQFSRESGIPTFTYSRRQNRFYNISNAAFADNLPCSLSYRVGDFFRMAGGTLRQGRVDNQKMERHSEKFADFFHLYEKHRKIWNDQITFFQKVSRIQKDMPVNLTACGNRQQKGEHGAKVYADEQFLRDAEKLGFIHSLSLAEEFVRFTFADELTRGWLRDVGSVLELYVYQLCRDTEIFDEVICSAIVDWDGSVGHDSVSNEIDVACTRKVIPLFISCKTCEVRTEAINELAILKERFGGKGAKAIVVTTELCNSAARHRAAQLGITVIDCEELEEERAKERIRIIMKVQPDIGNTACKNQ